MFEYAPVIVFGVSAIWGYWKIATKNINRFQMTTKNGKMHDLGLHVWLFIGSVSIAMPVYYLVSLSNIISELFSNKFGEAIWPTVIVIIILLAAIMRYGEFLNSKCDEYVVVRSLRKGRTSSRT